MADLKYDGEPSESPEILSLHWSIGYTPHEANFVRNLTNAEGKRFFYTSGHTGVIYDVKSKKQKFLRGHANEIKALCSTDDNKVVATADRGPNNMIAVWNTDSSTSVKIIPNPFTEGVMDMSLSPSKKYIVALSKETPQTLAVWDWQRKSNSPVASVVLGAGIEFQHCIRFNQSDEFEILTNGKKKMAFWSWEKDNALISSFPSKGLESLKVAGNITQSVFIPHTQKVVSATSTGYLLLWDVPLDHLQARTNRELIKGIKVGKGARLTSVQVVGKYICLGGNDGAISFFDFTMRSVAWFEDIKAGGIHSVSFTHQYIPAEEMKESDEFVTPDFIVSTSLGRIVELKSALFKEPQAFKRGGFPCLQGFDGEVTCVECHPTKPDLFATGVTSGMFILWSISERGQACTLNFGEPVTAIKFHPNGQKLVVGVSSGKVSVFKMEEHKKNGLSISLEAELTYLNQSISSISFSPCGNYFATGDLGRYVAVFRWYHRDERPDKPIEWIYVGRYRSHRKPIVSVAFLPSNWDAAADSEAMKLGNLNGTREVGADKAPPRLFSLGEDKLMQEYDVTNSSITKGLLLKSTTKVDQFNVPTTLLPIGGSDSMLTTSSDGYQIKLWVRNKSTPSGKEKEETKDAAFKCIGTMLSPTYGGPLSKMTCLQAVGKDGSLTDSQYVVYSTYNKVIGLIKLPFDGNPTKSTALIAHSGEITSMACTCDGQFVVTAGGKDRTVNICRVSIPAMESSIILGGDPKAAFIQLLESEGNQNIYEDIVDYFYFCQLKRQGLYTTDARKITGNIPEDQVVNLFRAMGYYPTEVEIANLMTEMHEKKSIPKTKEGIALVDFPTLVRLFVNYRPVYGLTRDDMIKTVSKLALTEKTIDKEDLLKFLKEYGDKFSDEELTKCLRLLQGTAETATLGQLLKKLPAKITADQVAEDILGFEA